MRRVLVTVLAVGATVLGACAPPPSPPKKDTTPPVLSLPEGVSVTATSADGAEVTYTATANDAVDGSVAVTCVPASGSWFSLGDTLVECEAVDKAGNRAEGSFTVTVFLDRPAVTRIDGGHGHTCMVTDAGTVKCWGWNVYGGLGDGTITDSAVPVDVVGLSDVVSVAAGVFGTCALREDGTVWCWGYNVDGQLGAGSVEPYSTTPVQVTGLSGVVSIGSFNRHVCTARVDGTAWCWGFNHYGQLGDGTTTSSNVPVQVEGVSDVVSVDAGWTHNCALLRDGAVRCWGDHELGQLGEAGAVGFGTPLGVTDAVSLAVAGYHSCVVLSDGRVQCWGYNDQGQVGDGTTGGKAEPRYVSGIDTAVSVTGGGYFGCALVDGGTARCWGLNDAGQIGNPDAGSNAPLPVPVAGASDVVAIGAGHYHACAVRADGSVQCWGSNEYGQLGDGTTDDSGVPVDVLLG